MLARAAACVYVSSVAHHRSIDHGPAARGPNQNAEKKTKGVSGFYGLFLVAIFYSILVAKLLNIETKILFYFLNLAIYSLKWNKMMGLSISPYKPNTL
jgi:hypothetical protein